MSYPEEPDGSFRIDCSWVPIQAVRQVFNRTKAHHLTSFFWVIASSETAPIPANLLGDSSANEVAIYCEETSHNLIISDTAFSSSSMNLTSFSIRNCDLTKQPNFAFLTGFKNISYLNVESKNVSSFQGIPNVIKTLSISDTLGLKNMADLPIALPNLQLLYVTNSNLNDEAAVNIVKYLTESSKRSLNQLHLSNNNLTKIPHLLISSFPKLEEVWLDGNAITMIDSQSMVLSGTRNVYLSNNPISTIQPNAFEGVLHQK